MFDIKDPAAMWSPWTPSSKEPWNTRRAAHLIRRAGFGVSFRQLDEMVKDGFESSMTSLFSMDSRDEFDESMKPMEQVLSSSQDPRSLASWWLLRMLQTPCQLLEKATLFWHGHFATGAEKVGNARAMLAQNRMLRDNALGNFEPMVQGISKDVAMLIYLDSEDNRKTRPNENYARELMELFCLGPGNYSEADIKELARCFTGWQIHRGSFRFNKYQHDRGDKSFLNVKGQYSGEEAVRVVLQQEAAPFFIAAKLVRFFVADEIETDKKTLAPLAKQLRESDFDLGATIRTILGSKMFYSDASMGKKVRSPVEMSIGLLRSLECQGNMNQLGTVLLDLGHLPMYPPNVKGWEGGRRWINASTYFGRTNLVRQIVNQNKDRFERGSIARSMRLTKTTDLEEWITQISDAWLAVELPNETRKQLLAIASRSGGSLNQKAVDVATAIGATPEFQLC